MLSDRPKKLEMIAALLREESTLALATADELGVPDVAPLFYLVDEGLTLYWLSSAASSHSQNLNKTPRAAVTVYRHAEHWKTICGVQMRGSVTAVTEQARCNALIKLYVERFQLGKIFRLAINKCTLYTFRPDFVRYIDNSKRFGYKFEFTLEQQDFDPAFSSRIQRPGESRLPG